MCSELKRPLLLSTLICGVLGALFLFYLQQRKAIEPQWNSVSYTLPTGKRTLTSLPITLPEEPLSALVELEFTLKEKFHPEYYFRQDDCLSSLVVNNQPVGLPATPYCDYWKGIFLDLKPYLRVGENRMTLVLMNRGGPGTLSIAIAGSSDRYRYLRAIVGLGWICGLALLALVWRRAGASAAHYPSQQIRTSRVLNYLALSAGIVIALAIRYILTPFETADARSFLYPWFDHLVSQGRFNGFRIAFADYAPSYLYLMSLASLFADSFPKLLLIKAPSILFDFFLAYAVYKVVGLLNPRPALAEIAFFCVLFAPTVILNGALWGQCDSIYTSFLVSCFYLLLRGRCFWATIALGIAASFKLQGLFFIPVLLLAWSHGRYHLRYLPLIPLVYSLSILPAWIAGRSLSELLLIYPSQTTTYRSLTMGAPTLYSWLPNDYYDLFYPAGMLLAVGVMLMLWLLTVRSEKELTNEKLASLAFCVVLLLPFFLPKMHERYFFIADIFAIIFAFTFPRYLWVPVLLQLISAFSYFPFLTGRTILDLNYLALVLVGVIGVAVIHLAQLLYSPERPKRVGLDIDL